MKSKILLVEDQNSFEDSIRLMLSEHPVEVVRAATGQEGINLYRRQIHSFATVVIDYCLPDLKGSQVVKQIKKANPDQDILFASGFRDPDNLLDLLETGGNRSFLYKGRPSEEIQSRILESLTLYQKQGRVIGIDEHLPSDIEHQLISENFVGKSQALYSVVQAIRKYRMSPYPVLIVGETGTGKELVARALVQSGKKLIAINCAQFSTNENLLESHLFGYVKGAFTGANQDQPGVLLQADNQVVFFDELHELSLTAQAKLLRFFQEMKYCRVGDYTGREISARFKLICAVKPDLSERIKGGRFLEDFYHRVGQLEIRIPSLRERIEDIEPIVQKVQEEFNVGKMETEQRQIRASTVREMEKYSWPGNVRQLQSATRQMLTNARSVVVEPKEFKNYLKNITLGSVSCVSNSLHESTRNFELEQVQNALKKSKTRSEAALKLGMSRFAFHRTLIRLGMKDLACRKTVKQGEAYD